MSHPLQAAGARAASPHDAGAARPARGATWVSWPMLLGAFAYALVLGKGGALKDGDTFWHIAAGRWILRHGQIPGKDPFSHTMPDAAWTAHEWLCEVVLAIAHDAGGWTAVTAVTALSFAVAVALLARVLLEKLEPTRAVLFAMLAVLMTMGHLVARPHVLAMPILVAWCAALVRARDERRSPGPWVLLLMVLWANMHAGFLLGVGLAAVFALEAVLEGRRDGRAVDAARSWGLFVGLTVASALLTPHGPQAFAYTWDVMTQHAFALDTISEWASPNFHGFQPMELWLLGTLALALATGLTLPPVRLLLVLGLVHMALKHVRYVELLGLIVPLVVAAPLAVQWRAAASRPGASAGPGRVARWLSGNARIGAVVTLVALLAAGTLLLARLQPVVIPEQAAPRQAIQAARDAGTTGPVLNSYNWGGYLIYAGIPPFIDGRAEMYGDAFYRQYFAAIYLQEPGALEKALGRYEVTWTLLAPGTPAIALLDCLPGWKRLYADENAVVHVRTPTP
ncbi:MAG: hypothetical protein ACXWC6_08840 [Ramlibacter sp.]